MFFPFSFLIQESSNMLFHRHRKVFQYILLQERLCMPGTTLDSAADKNNFLTTYSSRPIGLWCRYFCMQHHHPTLFEFPIYWGRATLRDRLAWSLAYHSHIKFNSICWPDHRIIIWEDEINVKLSRCWWLTPIILVTQEAEIRRITVWSQPR
jgi:hypothetical protein